MYVHMFFLINVKEFIFFYLFSLNNLYISLIQMMHISAIDKKKNKHDQAGESSIGTRATTPYVFKTKLMLLLHQFLFQ